MLHTKFDQDWPIVVLEKVVNAKCTTGDNRHKPGFLPITTGHLIDSGDLNKGSIKYFYTNLGFFNLDL